MTVKKCTKCYEEKKFSEFYKNKRKPFGLESRSKLCIKEDRIETKSKHSAYHKEWYKQNKNKKNKKNLENYYKNREERLLQTKEYHSRPTVKKRRSEVGGNITKNTK
jgi:hypothetical protein